MSKHAFYEMESSDIPAPSGESVCPFADSALGISKTLSCVSNTLIKLAKSISDGSFAIDTEINTVGIKPPKRKKKIGKKGTPGRPTKKKPKIDVAELEARKNAEKEAVRSKKAAYEEALRLKKRLAAEKLREKIRAKKEADKEALRVQRIELKAKREAEKVARRIQRAELRAKAAELRAKAASSKPVKTPRKVKKASPKPKRKKTKS